MTYWKKAFTEKENHEYDLVRGAVSGALVVAIVTIAIILMFFFPEGRRIIEYSGYVFAVVILIGCALMLYYEIGEIRGMHAEYMAQNSEEAKKWAEAPYEVEPAYMRYPDEDTALEQEKDETTGAGEAEETEEIEEADAVEEPQESEASEEPEETQESQEPEEPEPEEIEENARKVGDEYLFDSSALQAVSGALYGPYLADAGTERVTGNKKVVTMRHELSVLQRHEDDTFPGYTGYVFAHMEIIPTDKELDVLQREQSMINYVYDQEKKGIEVHIVTENPHFTTLAKDNSVTVLGVKEFNDIKNA